MPNEDNKVTKTILQYTITFGVCLILAFIVSCLMGLFTPWEVVKERTNWHIDSELSKVLFTLINGSFVVGVITLAFGLLVLAADGGAFEMLVYGFRRFISLFQKDVNKIKFKTFYDYHVYHSNKPKMPFLYLVVNGLIFVIVSLILVAIYNNNVGPFFSVK